MMAGRFKKISRIGRGTFGEAWLVTSTCSGRKYVIKEVRVDEMSDEELEKTRTEATILARCKHNSIIRYKEYFMLTDPATMCLVMEYADGGDLAEKVKMAKQNGMTLPESTILHWFIQVIFAVQYLHTNNILHRDLKTQNIFLTKTNLVKVGDFGIARFLRDKQDLATTAIGTPYYLSPEICQRRPYNHKSDMWAVGCILYELCALRHPFDAESFEDLIIKILKGAFRPLPLTFSSLLKDLISVMLRTNPERRPTADALLMLPALKPYVENYLMQYEDLLNRREKGTSSDDKVPLKSGLVDDNEESPLKELHANLKVRELDKRSANENHSSHEEGQEFKRQKTCAHSPLIGELVIAGNVARDCKIKSQSTNSPDSDLYRTPTKNMCLRQVDNHPLSSPISPLLPKTPARKYSSASNSASNSPIPPPAPPNTPVNKNITNTPPHIQIINVLSAYSQGSDSSPLCFSPMEGKFFNGNPGTPLGTSMWKTSGCAPTPCNTPTELKLLVSISPSSDEPGCSRGCRSLSPRVSPPKLSNIPSALPELDDLSDFEPITSPFKDLLSSKDAGDHFESQSKKEVSNNNVYCKRKCKSCGRSFSDTYIIDNSKVHENSTDMVTDL